MSRASPEGETAREGDVWPCGREQTPRAPTPQRVARSEFGDDSVDGVLDLVASVTRLVLDVALDVLDAPLRAVGASFRLKALVVRQ
jgi:hypothetical protein